MEIYKKYDRHCKYHVHYANKYNLWESGEGRNYFKWGNQVRLPGGGGIWEVCKQWVEFLQVKVGGRAIGAEEITEDRHGGGGREGPGAQGRWCSGCVETREWDGKCYETQRERQVRERQVRETTETSACAEESHSVRASRVGSRTWMWFWRIIWEAT